MDFSGGCREVMIWKPTLIAGVRTTIGKFNSALTPLGAVDLGIASFCIGGGQELVMVIERISS
jgi:hypothetical protein